MRPVAEFVEDPSSRTAAIWTRRREQWKRFVFFRYLQSCVAPLVECIVHLDRELFLVNGSVGNAINLLIPIFDADFSPRNVAIVSTKLVR